MLYPVHIPRNFLQYFISVIIFYTIFGEISIGKAILGSIAFIFSYQFAYALNDLVDYKYDIKDKRLVNKKQALNYPLHSGIVKSKELLKFSIIVFLIGILLASLVNPIFLLTQLSLFIFIFLHSNPFFRIKSVNLFLYFNMIIIQFIKFSLGWFSQIASLESFPYWLILLFSLVYVTAYRYYKSHFLTNLKISNTIDFLLISALLTSYIFSIILYDMIFSLIFTTIISLILYFFYFERLNSLKEKMQKGISVIELFYLILAFSLILTRLNPTIFHINYVLIGALESNPIIYFIKNLFV